MKNCPNFECLAVSEDCSRFPGCEGCKNADRCDVCARQNTLVDGTPIPCDLIDLPLPCRFCEKRQAGDFTSDVCLHCVKNSE